MTRKTVKDFDPEVMKLFDQFVHVQLNRRDFLQAYFQKQGSATSGTCDFYFQGNLDETTF